MDSRAAHAQKLFAEHVRRLEAGERSELDALCLESPELAPELRRLEADWSKMAKVLSRLAPGEGSFSEKLKEHYGESVDPHISLSDSSDGGSVGESSAALMSKLTSQRGSERYLEGDEIARGGMGAILKVWDEDLRRPLAMKVVLRDDGGTSGAATDLNSQKRLSRFLEEAQITSQLDHPGIVPVHDLGIDAEGRVYFTMQLVEGRDVREIVALAEKGEEGWGLRRFVGVLIRVCEALAYAHSKGVVHRDIKPGNVMVGKFGEVFLMDWGLAKVMGRDDEIEEPVSSIMHTLRSEGSSAEQTLVGDVVGTPAFMSPEQALGKAEDVGPASDLYAVGGMLYLMLSGQLPYQPLGDSASPLSILEAVKSGPPWPILNLRPEAPPELVAICEKAMAREVDDRFVDAMKLAQELRNWLEGNAVATYETGAFYSLRKWVGRNRGVSAALGGIFVVLFVSLGLLFEQAQKRISDLQDEQVLTSAAQREAGENLAQMKLEADRANRERDRAEERQRELFESKVLVQDLADTQRVLAEQSRGAGYRAQVIAAWFSLRLHEVKQTRQRLKDADAELRGWEWGYLNLNSDSSAIEPLRHENGSYELLAFDGKVSSMALDGSLRVFDTEDWSFSDQASSSGFLGPGALAAKQWGGVPCAISDTGVMATASYSSVIQLRDSDSYDLISSLRAPEDSDPVVSLALSLDGDFVASVDSGGSVRVWKVDTGVAVLEREGGSGLSCVSLNPVSNQVAFGGSDGAVEVWAFSEEADDEETGLTARFVERAADSFFEAFGMPRRDQVGRLTELEGRVNALSFSSDGSVLATAREDGEVHLWSPAPVDPEEAFRQGYVLTKRLKGHTLGVTCLSFSWDDLLIYAGGRDGTVRSWSVSDGSELGVFGGHRSEVRGIVTLSDERLVSGSMDGEVRVFDPYWQASRRTIADGGGKSALFVAEDPGGIDAISVSASGAVSREFPEASLVSSYDPPISGGDWTVGALCGERVALAGDDRVIRLFGFAPDDPVRELVGHDGEILALDSDQSGELLLSGGRDRRAILWSKLESENNEEWVMEHSRAVTSVALALDGETCATADSGNVLHSWGVDNREELMKWQVTGLGRVQGLAIQSDGASVACGLKLFAYLFEAGGAGASATFGPHDAEVKCLAFSADGRRLLTGDANGKIYVWDVGGEESLLELEGHAGAINSLGFADDGRTLLSSDSTGSVFAWRSQFDAERYRRWRRLERAPLRAKRIVEHFGGDLSVAAERILSGAPGLSSSDRAVLLILEEAELASSESSESAGDGDG